MRSRKEAFAEYDRIVKRHDQIVNEIKSILACDMNNEATSKTREILMQEYDSVSQRIQLVARELFPFGDHPN